MDELQLGVYATYIYVVLMIISVAILIFYSAITIQTHIITIPTPSLSNFEMLLQTYTDTLNCPCSEPAVYYDNMLTFSYPIYHQVKIITLKFRIMKHFGHVRWSSHRWSLEDNVIGDIHYVYWVIWMMSDEHDDSTGGPQRFFDLSKYNN